MNAERLIIAWLAAEQRAKERRDAALNAVVDAFLINLGKRGWTTEQLRKRAAKFEK